MGLECVNSNRMFTNESIQNNYTLYGYDGFKEMAIPKTAPCGTQELFHDLVTCFESNSGSRCNIGNVIQTASMSTLTFYESRYMNRESLS